MKKIFSLFLVAGMVVSFVGCGGDDAAKKTTPAPSSPSAKETPKK
jgi:predicted small lipoprotein YifL